MEHLIIALLFFGASGLALYGADLLFRCFLFAVYRLDGGRMGFIKYLKNF